MKKVKSHKALIDTFCSVAKGADAQRVAIAACRELGLFDSKLHLSQSPVGESMAHDLDCGIDPAW